MVEWICQGVDLPRKRRVEFPGAIYHVTVRGNGRQDIFLDDADRERFLESLAKRIEIHAVRLYLYCLMDNHVHMVLETPKTDADVSILLKRAEKDFIQKEIHQIIADLSLRDCP